MRTALKNQSKFTKDDDTDKGIIEEFSDGTTLHGVKHAIDETWPRRIIWSVLIVTSLILLIIQVTVQAKQYARNPLVVNVELEYKSEMNFPAVVICNTNQFKITSTKDNLYTLISEIYKTGRPDTKKVDFEKYTKQFENVHGSSLKYMEEAESTIEDMLLKCLWPNGTACHASDFDKFPTDYGVCYGINTDKHRPAKVTSAGVKHGIYLLINVEAYERTGGPMSTQGLKVLIFNQTDLPLVSFRGLDLVPGLFSQIGLTVSQLDKIHKKHGGSCITQAELEHFDGKNEYSIEKCELDKVVSHIEQECHCLPYNAPEHYRTDLNNETFCSIREHFSCVIEANEEIMTEDCLENCTTIRYKPQISASRLGTDSLGEMIGKEKSREMKEKYVNAINSRYTVQEDLVEKMDKHIENMKQLKAMLHDYNFEPVEGRFEGFWGSVSRKVQCAETVTEEIDHIDSLIDRLQRIDEDHAQGIFSQPIQYRIVYENDLDVLKNAYDLVDGQRWFEKWAMKYAEQRAKQEMEKLDDEEENADLILLQNETSSNKSLKELIAEHTNVKPTPLEMIFTIFKYYLGYCVDVDKQCAHSGKLICNDSEMAELGSGGIRVNKSTTKTGKTCKMWTETWHAEFGNHSECRAFHSNAGPRCIYSTTDDANWYNMHWENCFRDCDSPNIDEWFNATVDSEKTRQKKLILWQSLVSFKHETLPNLKNLVNLLKKVPDSYDDDELSRTAKGYDHFFRTIFAYANNTITTDQLAHGAIKDRESMTDRLAETINNLHDNLRHYRKFDLEKGNLSDLLFAINAAWQNNDAAVQELILQNEDRDEECITRINDLIGDSLPLNEKKIFSEACPVDRQNTDNHIETIKDTIECVAEIHDVVDEMEPKLNEIEEKINNDLMAFMEEMAVHTAHVDSTDYFYQNNILAVNIYYQELSVEKFVQQKAYSIFSLFSDIGGTLGLCLGASILTIFEIIDFFVAKPLLMYYKKKRIPSPMGSHHRTVNPYEVEQKQIEPPHLK